MAKNIIFSDAPRVIKSTIIPITSRVKETKRFIPLIDLSQHLPLKAGDKLQKGDEWYDDTLDVWHQTRLAYDYAGTVRTYRRRLHGNKYG